MNIKQIKSFVYWLSLNTVYYHLSVNSIISFETKKYKSLAMSLYCWKPNPDHKILNNPTSKNKIQYISIFITRFTKIKQNYLLLDAFLLSYKFYAAMLTYGEFAFFGRLKNMFSLILWRRNFFLGWRVSWPFNYNPRN